MDKKDRKMIDELSHLMREHEEFLEKALDDMEFGGDLTNDQVSVIRWACGKPKKSAPVLRELFNDFGTIFGGKQ